MATLIGNIHLHKRLRQHAVWQRPDYGYCWVDLLLLANDQPRQAFVNGEPYNIKRGQLAWSLRTLEKEWGKSRSWLDAFISFCRDEGMIQVDSNPRRTIITILNYDAYNPINVRTEEQTESPTEVPTDVRTEEQRNRETGIGKGKVEGAAAANAGDSEVPSESDALRFASEFLGDAARGIPPKIPEAWVLEWYAWRSGSSWPKRWRDDLVRRFTSDWLAHRAKARPGIEAKKSGALRRERGEILQEMALAKKNGAPVRELEKELAEA